jgi:hypothetical protein
MKVVVGAFSAAAGSIATLLYWLPNPLLWLGLYLLDRGLIKAVLAVGTLAGLLAMLPVLSSARDIAGLAHSPAYVAWLAAMLLLVAAGYLGLLFRRKPDAILEKLWAAEIELSALRSETHELREWVLWRRAVPDQYRETNQSG